MTQKLIGNNDDDTMMKYWKFGTSKSLILPTTIQNQNLHPRLYESRIDLLRAVIKGVEGTPYHDGLFCFDIRFPKNYPDKLPLTNEWKTRIDREWKIPKMAYLGMILNEKPYFNEPGYEGMRDSYKGEQKSLKYNERTLLCSLYHE
ncbi:ubiquitin-conjugating enzyme 25 [Artemisia annua]|uniref:Ubiquitin-conjugating enzyme 25 n=1 Tax=Artemisia annua TaxID=35608 RepID=A0A2U1MY67_ARTAN|nr:ubiquitin-conjugating enzyme 25 [Artemisia annua]